MSADINCFQPLNFPGKTLLLEHFASLFGLCQEDVLSVQLDEQTDSKVRKPVHSLYSRCKRNFSMNHLQELDI